MSTKTKVKEVIPNLFKFVIMDSFFENDDSITRTDASDEVDEIVEGHVEDCMDYPDPRDEITVGVYKLVHYVTVKRVVTRKTINVK
jgi:hypothetical protein